MDDVLRGSGARLLRVGSGGRGIVPAPSVVNGVLRATLHLLPTEPVDIADPAWSPVWSLVDADGETVASVGGGASGSHELMTLEHDFDVSDRRLDGEWTLSAVDRSGRYDCRLTIRLDSARGAVAITAAE